MGRGSWRADEGLLRGAVLFSLRQGERTAILEENNRF